MRVSLRIRYTAIFLMLLFLLSACAGSTISVKSPSDYRAGSQMAETMAKEDARNSTCTPNYPFYRSNMNTHLNRHLADLKADQSDSFIQGFRYQYEETYLEYIRSYCQE